ncbi:MAG: hypothetical protein ABS55_01330 [Lautropia sp. SCN 70-15]|nr:MAG: hypothetical protein ABS55_01330 [Lautropia sp. SCN 70-15]
MTGEFVRLTGVEDLKRALQALPWQLRRKALRGALRSAAKVIQGEARARAPVLLQSTPYRTRGLVRRSISVTSSKLARKRGDVGVFLTVRRGRSALNRGAYLTLSRRLVRPNDPFYFKFLELGTKKMKPRPFLGPAFRAKATQAVQAFERGVRPEIANLNRRK